MLQVVAGKAMAVTCPVAGYPISSITWEKEGRQLPFNDRQSVFTNGTLVISNLQRKEDAATYTCVARNDEGYSARSDLSVTVMGKLDRQFNIHSVNELHHICLTNVYVINYVC